MPKYDVAVMGRTVMVGVVAGAGTGAVVIPLVMLADGLSRGDLDGSGFVKGVLVGFFSLGAIGAVAGMVAGVVAGTLLFLVSPWLSGWPRPAVRAVAAVACAGGFGLPMLVVGLGWGLWLSEPWTELAWMSMAIATVAGGWRGPYLVSGAPVRERATAASE